MNELARPAARRATSLPNQDLIERIQAQFNLIKDEVHTLPSSIVNAPIVDAELRSLRAETDASVELLARIKVLASLSDYIQ